MWPSASPSGPRRRNFDRFKRFALLDVDATRGLDPDWFDAWDACTRARASDATTKKMMRHLVSEQRKPIDDEDLDRINVPTTLVWGRGDRMVPVAVAEHAAARHGWPLHVIEHAAHAPHVEQPDEFVDVMRGVLGASRRDGARTARPVREEDELGRTLSREEIEALLPRRARQPQSMDGSSSETAEGRSNA